MSSTSILNKDVTALYVRKDSVYKTLLADVYDIDRDARNYKGANPVIAHPPCRAWGKLHYFARPQHDEKELAKKAVDVIRTNGGVLEHPAYSKLWKAVPLPLPGQSPDIFGGWTLSINQSWFGHRAEKNTWLYIVGCLPKQIPPYKVTFDTVTHVIATTRGKKRKPEVTKKEREHTPELLAKWLVELAARCHR